MITVGYIAMRECDLCGARRNYNKLVLVDGLRLCRDCYIKHVGSFESKMLGKLSFNQARSYLRVGVKTLNRLVVNGKLHPYRNISGRYLFDFGELKALEQATQPNNEVKKDVKDIIR